MDTEEDTVSSGETCEKMIQFVSVIEKFPILLEKSNIPDVKRKKANAIYEIKGKLAVEFGIELNDTQIWKKLNNLKTRIKRKTDKKQTGNRKIELKDWEIRFFKYIEGEINPSICKVKGKSSIQQIFSGAISAGVRSCGMEVAEISLEQNEIQLKEPGSFITSGTGSVKSADSDYPVPGTSKTSSVMSKGVNEGPLKNQKHKKKLPETEETKNLTTQELQRLVLLEQLQVFRLAKELLLQKKQQKDMEQVNPNTQGDATDAILLNIPDNENIDENFPIFINL
ncbi:uncharacterized protein LOC111692787 [Anoplophora glabripennis]|uniref:uncharacterized protein LOC111692787 n=1 Tax=Anoplophora glabripennis TaxID=217634 RepID=UPI000C7608C0|nr:uncharacterized protein LOC111692787 [Anoplophora glabripennis]